MNPADTILALAKSNNQLLVESPEWWKELVGAVQHLLANDFSGLVQVLYRLDVDEGKIRASLANQPHADAAELIAKLLLERQLQKLAFRQNLQTPPPVDDEEELW